jgi:nucleoside-diphosphate-sugar epimerase
MLERDADYLPLDDNHRGLPSAPYALSKWLCEEMCEAFTTRTGVQTLCLRPVQVFDQSDYQRALATENSASRPGTVWALGVHLNVLDLAEAASAAVTCTAPAHSRMLLCAADIASAQPTLQLVAERASHIPWHGGQEYKTEPFRALVDISTARRVLNWRPMYTWPGR